MGQVGDKHFFLREILSIFLHSLQAAVSSDVDINCHSLAAFYLNNFGENLNKPLLGEIPWFRYCMQRSTGTGTKKPGTFPGTKIFEKSGAGGNREQNFLKIRERAGTGNKIFEKIGNGREHNFWNYREAKGMAIFRNPPVTRKREVWMTISGMVETVFILTDQWEFYYSKWFGHFRTAYTFFEVHMLFSYWKKFFEVILQYSN